MIHVLRYALVVCFAFVLWPWGHPTSRLVHRRHQIVQHSHVRHENLSAAIEHCSKVSHGGALAYVQCRYLANGISGVIVFDPHTYASDQIAAGNVRQFIGFGTRGVRHCVSQCRYLIWDSNIGEVGASSLPSYVATN